MLYWGEGEKGGYVRISNTDVALLQLFMRFLKEHYMATSEDSAFALISTTGIHLMTYRITG
jgi:hypothetical protein